ncbi:gluconate 2-dehydrogenase subunit 3 family protein [Bordetella holmesii]|uniref:Gluconate 2-dehydrogenase subunit 3 n=3 Tax=Bordetella holmesii TaxID=35814 RepID=A0A158M5D8_9BORD|nr:gluconate 2-dehydrogenase subunit 3 family protein [Bordetella holmesii]AIT27347.1 gluconate 2-dehydrogenase subunit 3 family protein [Bordetella holmesii 44057]EWM42064.1 gluconate 2-dehydrogenase subunit 3 family protein [Bordetella holmesii 41130]EWM47935.1 gluconate 2-dehydrogenase subunit 3 family protein [Bordetella holmesii 35009]EWM52095.1 gluconate 2-dehydrogenase subunit 3 family protein [Bordetella holmesii 70147]EXF87384.1 gluconate 2-dehydrogenase subunit 3 family protein [Bord
MEDFKESRRVFLRGAVIGGTAAAGASLPLAGLAQQAATPAAPAAAPTAEDTPAGYVFLMPDEAAFVEALVMHMVPAAGGLGGSGMDLGLNTYIDRALAGNWGKGDRLFMQGPWQLGTPNQGYQLALSPAELMRTGILQTNASCSKKYEGKSFDMVTEDQREEILKGLESGTIAFEAGPPSKVFFTLLYQLVVEGLFADPIYGGNYDKAVWKEIGFPGVVATNARNIVEFKNKPFPNKPLSIADLA